LQAIRDVLQDNPQVYVVNEGANALDLARNTIGMQVPRHRLDSGTWGVMGIGMGYAIAAAVETSDPVVAIEGDSAFGFSGMELEAVCRYNLPIVTVILNNSGVYRGDDISASGDPAPTALRARHEFMIKAFGGKGYQATTPTEVAACLREALANPGDRLEDAGELGPSRACVQASQFPARLDGVEPRPFALDEAHALAERVRHQQNVGKQDRCVEAEASDRLQRRLGGKLRRVAELQEVAGLRAQCSIFRQVASGLPHQPDGRRRQRLSGEDAQQPALVSFTRQRHVLFQFKNPDSESVIKTLTQ
jgi:hypothetical protein